MTDLPATPTAPATPAPSATPATSSSASQPVATPAPSAASSSAPQPPATQSSAVHGTLQRSLSNRHIQLIALGGTLGTGLFLGSAGALQLAGPSMLLGYAICGLFAFLILRFLAEMIVDEPVAGAFSYFAHTYWGRFPGFLVGWNCVACYILVGMLELSAAGKFMHFWFPEMPTWVTAAVFFVLINVMNLFSVKVFGETEFWFSMIKVIAVIGMIVLGGYLLFSGKGGEQASVRNLWQIGGFFPNGAGGLAMAMTIIVFSFGGLEMLGFTAAEAHDPAHVVPKAVNQVVYRVMIFYIGSTAVMLCLLPWNTLLAAITSNQDVYKASPFVLIFSMLYERFAADGLNFVILTAALSVYNGMVYCTSRLLFGMAKQGDAPAFLAKVDTRGVPIRAILLPACLTASCVLLNFLMPASVIEMLIALVTATLIITWGVITITHLRFRAVKLAQAKEAALQALVCPAQPMASSAAAEGLAMSPIKLHGKPFRAPWQPWSNYLCLAFMAGIIVAMLQRPSMSGPALAIPIWLVVLYAFYLIWGQPREHEETVASKGN